MTRLGCRSQRRRDRRPSRSAIAAAPDETLDPVIGNANSIAAALGGRFAIMPSLYVAGSYTNLHFIDRSTIGRSELAQPSFPTSRHSDRYSQWIGLFNANVEFVLSG